MTILFTGYEPFGDWAINPTAEAAKVLDGKEFNGHRIIARILPLRYKEIEPELQKLVNEYKPNAIVLSGQAGGAEIRLERIAKNIVNCNIPYNCGTLVNSEIISEIGPDAHKSTLPLERVMSEINKAGIPVRYSDDAGEFGCNQVFYHGREDFPDIPTGFIHVPLLPEQVTGNKPSMEQENITLALEIVVKSVADWLENNA